MRELFRNFATNIHYLSLNKHVFRNVTKLVKKREPVDDI